MKPTLIPPAVRRSRYALLAAFGAASLAACGDAEKVDQAAAREQVPIARQVDPVPDDPGIVTRGDVAAGTASALQTARGPCGSYGDWDQDGDGRFEAGEYEAYRNVIFRNWDTDQDRRVSKGEFQVCWAGAGWRSALTAFTAFDADANGYLAQNEMFGGEYAALDRNRSGVLEGDEWPWFEPVGERTP